MKRIKLFLITGLICILSVNLYSQQIEREKVVTVGYYSAFQEIYEKYGVKVVTDVDDVIPSSWYYSPANAKIVAASSSVYDKAAKAIEKALSQYPKSFLTKNLYKIGIYESLEMYGAPYGGTTSYDEHSVVFSVKDWSSEQWMVETIHHEFNHLLVYLHSFPEAQWKSCNKPGFRYGGGGVEAILNGTSSTDRVESAFREGFVNQYAMSDYLEDIATMTEFAIGDRADFLRRAVQYPIIANKYQILKSFYYNLDSYFDEDFWNGNKVDAYSSSYTNSYDYQSQDNYSDYDYSDYDSSYTSNTSVVDSLYFYEYYSSDQFDTEFYASDSTRIGYYVILNNSQLSYSFDISAYYYYPDGSEMGNFTHTYERDSGDYSYCYWAFGWDDPGYWSRGEYKVILYLDGEYLTEGYFTMK